MWKSLQFISQGCFEIVFVSCCVVGVGCLIRRLLTGQGERKIGFLAVLLLLMIGWRLPLAVKSFRYAIALSVPGAILTAVGYEWLCRGGKKYSALLNWGGLLLLIALTVGVTCRTMYGSRHDRENLVSIGREIKNFSASGRSLAVIDVGGHGIKMLYEANWPQTFYQTVELGTFPQAFRKHLELADKIVIFTTDKKYAQVREALPGNTLPMQIFECGRYKAMALDNREAYHWGRAVPDKKSAAGRSVVLIDFEKPTLLPVQTNSDAYWFLTQGYPFFDGNKMFFVPELRLRKRGDLKPAKKKDARIMVYGRDSGKAVIAGNYSCYFRSSEQFSFSSIQLSNHGSYCFDVKFSGQKRSRIIFEALFVNRQGTFETRPLGSFTILDPDQVRHGSFTADTGNFQCRDGKFELLITLLGELSLDDLHISAD